MNRTEMEKLLRIKLKELERVSREFLKDTIPSTPLPRVKSFRLSKEIVFYMEPKATFRFAIENLRFTLELSIDNITYSILEVSGYKPRDVLRIVRRIEAIMDWFRRRIEGRKRMAEEILRQQRKFVEALEAEAALVSLSK
ncbi:MAG: hypothetical protein QXS54_10995 [Candidatus Methanomethylicaceae archaeon]